MSTLFNEALVFSDISTSAATERADAVGDPQVRTLSAVELCLIVLATIAILGFMHAAAVFLIPLFFAILISYTLSPAVAMLERWRVPRSLGALLMLGFVNSALIALCYSLSDDVGKLTDLVPRAAAKVTSLVRDQNGVPPKSLANLQKAAKELEKAAAQATGDTRASARPKAAATEGSVAQSIQKWMVAQTSQAIGVIIQLGTAMLIAFFLLAGGNAFRRKVARLAGPTLARRRVAISVLNSINVQIQRYLATIALINVLIAGATWAVLAYIGLEHALFLGMLAGILHIIPYIGTPIAAGIVGLVALVQFNDPYQAGYLMFAVISISILLGVVLTSLVQSRASRMNAVVVVAGVLFFGWLWKGWGLILAVPMLAVLKSIADGIAPLWPLSEFLGE